MSIKIKVLGVIFTAYNIKENHFAKCVVFAKEEVFSIANLYKFSGKKNYYICSRIKIDYLEEKSCREHGGNLWKKFVVAKEEGFSINISRDKGNLNMNPYRVPRFKESDLERAINNIGGEKIKEGNEKTPDFIVDGIVLELKDLQKESLRNKDRQNSIAKLFKDIDDYSINIDPSLCIEGITPKYHRLIKNTIKNNFKAASKQIKQYAKNKKIKGAGIAIFNTGLYSLPNELLKKMVDDIIEDETEIIEFAFIFQQRMQTNGWKLYSLFSCEWSGEVPERMRELGSMMNNLIDVKMSEMMVSNNCEKYIESQEPISFEIDNKIFFWNPGSLSFPWEKE